MLMDSDLTYTEALNMARAMKETGDAVRKLIEKCQDANHGVVAMKFTDECTKVQIEVLDEPYEPNVRIYPHWQERS